jgi:hypothetical protein
MGEQAPASLAEAFGVTKLISYPALVTKQTIS